MPKNPPIPWAELAKTMPDEYKNRRDPQEMEGCKVRVQILSVTVKRPTRKLKPLTAEQKALACQIERYFSLKDLTDAATPQK